MDSNGLARIRVGGLRHCGGWFCCCAAVVRGCICVRGMVPIARHLNTQNDSITYKFLSVKPICCFHRSVFFHQYCFFPVCTEMQYPHLLKMGAQCILHTLIGAAKCDDTDGARSTMSAVDNCSNYLADTLQRVLTVMASVRYGY